MKRFFVVSSGILAVVSILLLVGSMSAYACDFYFNYDSIEAPLGAEGKIGVQVVKTHIRCTMPDELGYEFDWEHIQILGETQWEEVDSNVYEKWFWVSLSSPGEGYLRISSECTKEGYNEKVLPITVLTPAPGGVWEEAMNGSYPLSSESPGAIASVSGTGEVGKDRVVVAGTTFALPAVPGDLAGYEGEVHVFYQEENTAGGALLVVGEGIFIRFDQYAD